MNFWGQIAGNHSFYSLAGHTPAGAGLVHQGTQRIAPCHSSAAWGVRGMAKDLNLPLNVAECNCSAILAERKGKRTHPTVSVQPRPNKKQDDHEMTSSKWFPVGFAAYFGVTPPHPCLLKLHLPIATLSPLQVLKYQDLKPAQLLQGLHLPPPLQTTFQGKLLPPGSAHRMHHTSWATAEFPQQIVSWTVRIYRDSRAGNSSDSA